MLLSWMFISSYTTIYFFVNKKYFFEYLYFSEYDTWMSRGHLLSTYATWRGIVGVMQNATCVTEMHCPILAVPKLTQK